MDPVRLARCTEESGHWVQFEITASLQPAVNKSWTEAAEQRKFGRREGKDIHWRTLHRGCWRRTVFCFFFFFLSDLCTLSLPVWHYRFSLTLSILLESLTAPEAKQNKNKPESAQKHQSPRSCLFLKHRQEKKGQRGSLTDVEMFGESLIQSWLHSTVNEQGGIWGAASWLANAAASFWET